MREAFAMQKLLTVFQQKILAYLIYYRLKFNETLTNDVVSFEQPGTDLLTSQKCQTSDANPIMKYMNSHELLIEVYK